MGKCGDEGAAAKREGDNVEVGFSQFTWGLDAIGRTKHSLKPQISINQSINQCFYFRHSEC